MTTLRFWLAVFFSGTLHVAPVAYCFVGHWPWGQTDSPAELIQPYGNSDRDGFDVDYVSLNPGTYRQGNEHTPGGDNAPDKNTPIASEVEDQPLVMDARPAEPTAPLPPTLPVIPVEPTRTEPTTPSTSTKTGLPGAPGGADMPLGTPTRGGTVGVLTGVKLLEGGRKIYPAEALRLELEGTPQVWVRISEEGDVIEVKLDKPCKHEILNRAALRYAWTMKFRPARRGGTPVESTAIQPVEYKLP